MSIAKRLRFEILRRDGYRCRYCGADDNLVVDHVLPEALGGLTEAANLVTACQPCNVGKSSTAPDGVIVEDVVHDAQRWARAVAMAAEMRACDHRLVLDGLRLIDDAWGRWRTGSGKNEQPIPRPSDWQRSIQQFMELGLPIEAMERFIIAAMSAQQIHSTDTWVYFCGCCWKEIRGLQDLAKRLLNDGDCSL